MKIVLGILALVLTATFVGELSKTIFMVHQAPINLTLVVRGFITLVSIVVAFKYQSYSDSNYRD